MRGRTKRKPRGIVRPRGSRGGETAGRRRWAGGKVRATAINPIRPSSARRRKGTHRAARHPVRLRVAGADCGDGHRRPVRQAQMPPSRVLAKEVRPTRGRDGRDRAGDCGDAPIARTRGPCLSGADEAQRPSQGPPARGRMKSVQQSGQRRDRGRDPDRAGDRGVRRDRAHQPCRPPRADEAPGPRATRRLGRGPCAADGGAPPALWTGGPDFPPPQTSGRQARAQPARANPGAVPGRPGSGGRRG